jgi:hypothetical protein
MFGVVSAHGEDRPAFLATLRHWKQDDRIQTFRGVTGCGSAPSFFRLRICLVPRQTDFAGLHITPVKDALSCVDGHVNHCPVAVYLDRPAAVLSKTGEARP